MVSSLQTNQGQANQASIAKANIPSLCSLMIEDELVAMKAQDVLTCFKTPVSSNKMDWYAKIKEKFANVEVAKKEATLEKFLRLVVTRKNESLLKYMNTFQDIGLFATSSDQFEQYTNLQTHLEQLYKRYPLEAVLGIECPDNVKFEHRAIIKNCVNAEVKKNKKVTLQGTSQKPVSLDNEQIKLIVSALLSAQTRYQLLLKKVELEDAQLQLLKELFTSGKLDTLDVSDNKLTDKAAQFLADVAMQKGCEVTSLILQNNQITDQGALLFLPYLTQKIAATLDLRGNKTTQIAKAALEKAVSGADAFSILEI